MMEATLRSREFGRYLKQLREGKGLSQRTCADVSGLQQGLLAQYEVGVAHPGASNVHRLATAFRVDAMEFWLRIAYDKLAIKTLPEGVPCPAGLSPGPEGRRLYEELQSARLELFLSALRMPQTAHVRDAEAEIVQLRSMAHVMSEHPVLDVPGMVEWQRTFPALDIFWVVNLNFIDNVEPMVFEAVKQNLARGVRYVYFVREEDTAPGREFDLLLHRLRMSVGDAAVVRQIVPVPVSATDLQSRFRDLIFDFVVANPQLTRQGTSVAFQNVREGGQVAFAVGLKHFDATVNRLREYAFEQNLTAVWDTMAACCTA